MEPQLYDGRREILDETWDLADGVGLAGDPPAETAAESAEPREAGGPERAAENPGAASGGELRALGSTTASLP
jgi:hypothetical protein